MLLASATILSYCSFAMATLSVWFAISVVRLSVFLASSSSAVAVSPLVASQSLYSLSAASILALLAFSFFEYSSASLSAAVFVLFEVPEWPLLVEPVASAAVSDVF